MHPFSEAREAITRQIDHLYDSWIPDRKSEDESTVQQLARFQFYFLKPLLDKISWPFEKNSDRLSALPKDVICLILSHLELKDLSQVARVARLYQQLVIRAWTMPLFDTWNNRLEAIRILSKNDPVFLRFVVVSTTCRMEAASPKRTWHLVLSDQQMAENLNLNEIKAYTLFCNSQLKASRLPDLSKFFKTTIGLAIQAKWRRVHQRKMLSDEEIQKAYYLKSEIGLMFVHPAYSRTERRIKPVCAL